MFGVRECYVNVIVVCGWRGERVKSSRAQGTNADNQLAAYIWVKRRMYPICSVGINGLPKHTHTQQTSDSSQTFDIFQLIVYTIFRYCVLFAAAASGIADTHLAHTHTWEKIYIIYGFRVGFTS